jgi:RNA ligase (TIGR02306 family)
MAQWKVTREQIEIFPHPNPEVLRLELGKAGQYQVVVGKGIFQNGSTIIFVPEKSVLPDSIADEGDRRKHLTGTNKNRVKSMVMQKEITQGIILDDRPELAHIPLGEDVSAMLGITRYVAPIPDELKGAVFSLNTIDSNIHKHDVETFNIFPTEFSPGERVIVSEKIHGTQGTYVRLSDGQRLVTSKGLMANEQFFQGYSICSISSIQI